MTTESPSVSSSSRSFPPVSQLFTDAWGIFKKTWLMFLLWSILGLVVTSAIWFIAILIGIPSGFGALWPLFVEKDSAALAKALQGVSLTVLYIDIAIAFILTVIFELIYVAGFIYIVDSSRNQRSFGQILLLSIKRAWPILITCWILTPFLLWGGFFLFIIPGIIFWFLLLFVSFEVVLGDKHYIGAMKESIRLVKSNVGDVLVRVLIINGILILVVCMQLLIFTPVDFVLRFSTRDNPFLVFPFQFTLEFFRFIFNTIFSWAAIIFSYVLYRHSQEAENKTLPVRMWWMWLVATVGWILGIIILGLVSFALYSFVSSGALQKMLNSSTKKSAPLAVPVKQSANQTKAEEYVKAGKTKLDTAEKMAQKTPLTAQEQSGIQILVQSALSDFQSATEVDPDNYLAWVYRGEAYRRLIGFTDNAEGFAISSFKKAIELDSSNDPYPYYALGGIYYQMGDYENSAENFQKVVELNPKGANGYYNLGYAYMRSGNKVQARIAFQKVLDLLPASAPDRIKAEEALQSL